MTAIRHKAATPAIPYSAARHVRYLCRCVTGVVIAALLFGLAIAAGGCATGTTTSAEDVPDVLVTTGHLLDITENIAGGRLTVRGLLPPGIDPHVFQPTPGAARLVAKSPLIIIDAYGLAPVVDELIQSSRRAEQIVVEAAAGLKGRVVEHDHGGAQSRTEIDPHYWLDPVNVITYADNIQKALAQADPDGATVYRANAAAYSEELRALDAWINEQVAQIPPQRRLLVTNHESLGYFAARYGFTLVGTVVGGVSADAAPSAQQLASLVTLIRDTGVPAIFLETGSDDSLAAQVAREAGVELVTDFYTHSVGDDAPTYIDMMRWDVTRIVEALR